MFDSALIVLEPTGGLEQDVANLLVETGFDVAVVDARQIRDYAKATGLLAKSDRLDAEVIARFSGAKSLRKSELDSILEIVENFGQKPPSETAQQQGPQRPHWVAEAERLADAWIETHKKAE